MFPYVPATHGMQYVLSDGSVPNGHAVHSVLPSVSATGFNDVTLHGIHCDWPALACAVPTVHATHAFVWLSTYVPASQMEHVVVVTGPVVHVLHSTCLGMF
jgi:hypothetical protein